MANGSVADSSKAQRNDNAAKVYEQICENIRTTDDVSFKLLGFVPLFSSSGVAILSIARFREVISCPAVILVSLAAAVITFGLFKWERRNVQRCNWLIARAAELELTLFCDLSGRQQDDTSRPSTELHVHQFAGWKAHKAPPLFGRAKRGSEPDPHAASNEEPRVPWSAHVGKEKAETIIYVACIAAWLIPIAVTVLTEMGASRCSDLLNALFHNR